MVRIRLMRVGKRKQPSYRVVVADARSPRDGRIIESIGHYQPREDPSVISIDTDRAVHWLQRGAQPSDQVRKLLTLSGAWSAFSGEAPPPGLASEAQASPAAAPTRRRKATPAASVTEEGVAELPEAVDQAPAAPENDPAAEGAAAATTDGR